MPAIEAACDALRAKLDALADAAHLSRDAAIVEILAHAGSVSADALTEPGKEAERFFFPVVRRALCRSALR